MYKGQLEGFPSEVVEKMLFYQEQQGNKRDVNVFERNKALGKPVEGFTWDKTPESFYFWEAVISKKEFDIFFEKYPKTEYTIEDLKEGKVALEFNNSIDSVDDLNKILKIAFDNSTAWGDEIFYFKSPYSWGASKFTSLPTQLLSQFLKQINMKKQTLTRKQLLELYHSFTCSDWRSAIQSLAKEFWDLDEIEIPQTLINKLLEDGTSDQKAKVKEYGIVLETPCPYKDGELIFVKINDDIWNLRYATGVMEDGRAQVYDYQEKKSNCKSYYKSHAPAHGSVLPPKI